jgi:hypothetical protein
MKELPKKYTSIRPEPFIGMPVLHSDGIWSTVSEISRESSLVFMSERRCLTRVCHPLIRLPGEPLDTEEGYNWENTVLLPKELQSKDVRDTPFLALVFDQGKWDWNRLTEFIPKEDDSCQYVWKSPDSHTGIVYILKDIALSVLIKLPGNSSAKHTGDNLKDLNNDGRSACAGCGGNLTRLVLFLGNTKYCKKCE